MLFCEPFETATKAIDVKKKSPCFSKLKVCHETLSVVFAQIVLPQCLGPGVAFSLCYKEKHLSISGFTV